MRALIFIVALTLASLVGSAPARAQEGHPLKGSWIGTWTGNKTHGNDVVLVMNWDGKAITGMINPGTDNIPIKTATLNPTGWVVHIEADAQGQRGSGGQLRHRRQDREPPAAQPHHHRNVEEPERERRLQDRQTVGEWR